MRPFLPLLLLAACSGDKSATTDSGADTDTEDTDTPTTGCTAPSEGGWSMNGSCFGMLMTGTLTVESDGCSFTFSDWDMPMSVPDGGTVDGDDVTLDWPGLDGCTGTTDGTSMEGSCGDGCTWDGTFDG